ncbi:MAG: hypothetical protein AAF958_12130 [Planctomycetota bacterium]
MSYSPFEVFRKNLKPLMVGLTLLALFAFVVLPAMQGSPGGGGGQVVARFAGTELTRERVNYFTRNHQNTIRFLRKLAEDTIKKGGQPRVAEFAVDSSSGQIRSIGINQNSSAQTSIATLAYANAAREQGFDLVDGDLDAWLDQFTDERFTDNEVDARLAKETRNQMGRQHLYEQLRSHLLARLFERRGTAAVAMGNMELKTPMQMWEAFLKLNRQASVNTYGVLTNDFMDNDADVSDAAVNQLYEAAKDRDRSNASPEPGFHRRYAATIESVAFDFKEMVEREKQKIDESELRAEYERRKLGGAFRMPLPDEMDLDGPTTDGADEDETDGGADNDPAEMNEEGTETPQDDAPVIDAGGTATGQDSMPETDKPETDKPETAKPETDKPETNKPEADKPETNATETNATETNATESDKPETSKSKTEKSETGKQEGDDSASVNPTRAIRLVAARQDDGDDPPATTEAAADETTDPAPQSNETQSTDETESSTADAAAGEMEDPPAAATNEDTAADGNTAADGDSAENAGEDTPKPPAENQFKPFEEVRDIIADDLARPRARELVRQRVVELRTIMNNYFRERSMYELTKSSDDVETIAEPKRPDIKALAERYGSEFKEFELVDVVEMQDEEIADSYEDTLQINVRGNAFSFYMFGNPQFQAEPRQLFQPLLTIDDIAEKNYVSWKTAERQPYTPELEEVRDEVVEALKRMEARRLAREAAEKLALEIRESGKSLSEQVPEDRAQQYKSELGPFTWLVAMQMGSVIGNVSDLDNVGDKFMAATFATDVGGIGVGPNRTESVFYVIEPTNFEPSIESLREQFRQPFPRQIAAFRVNGSAEIQNDFFNDVQTATGLQMMLEE